jgi:1-deoxy-D-xylulose-5-phosphate synthase
VTTKLLATIREPADLKGLSLPQLEQLASEMREVLCNLIACRSAHFASNLGVVELCLALHQTFDFRHDRLIWDTGHQIYPHKLITGRFAAFHTMRTKGGLMGYPNPAESEFDLFMTGHAGPSVSTALGLASGDALLRPEEGRHSVAVIGDGAFPSGVVFEALNNARRQSNKFLVILNDNRMSICPRVGGVADYLDRLRMNPVYTGLKDEVVKMLNHVPLLGDPVERFLVQLKEAAKAGLSGGMMFEELGFRYIGPIDGHNIGLLRKYLKMTQRIESPVLLHVVTEKGHGFQPAADDPVTYHAPPQFERRQDEIVALKKASAAVLPTWQPKPLLQLRTIHLSPRSRPQCAKGISSRRCATNSRSDSSTWGSARPTPWRSPRGRPRRGCGRSSISTARSCSARTTRSSKRLPCRTCR